MFPLRSASIDLREARNPQRGPPRDHRGGCAAALGQRLDDVPGQHLVGQLAGDAGQARCRPPLLLDFIGVVAAIAKAVPDDRVGPVVELDPIYERRGLAMGVR